VYWQFVAFRSAKERPFAERKATLARLKLFPGLADLDAGDCMKRTLPLFVCLAMFGCMTPVTDRLDRMNSQLESSNRELAGVHREIEAANRRLDETNARLKSLEELLGRMPLLKPKAAAPEGDERPAS